MPTIEDYANRVSYLRQIADELDADAKTAPCSEASIIREAADEIEALREVAQSAMRHINSFEPGTLEGSELNLANTLLALCNR